MRVRHKMEAGPVYSEAPFSTKEFGPPAILPAILKDRWTVNGVFHSYRLFGASESLWHLATTRGPHCAHCLDLLPNLAGVISLYEYNMMIGTEA